MPRRDDGPCASILPTTTVNGRAVGVSLIGLGIPGTAQLPAGPTAVATPDAFDCIGQDSGIDIVDVRYLQGPTPNDDESTVPMTNDVFLQI